MDEEIVGTSENEETESENFEDRFSDEITGSPDSQESTDASQPANGRGSGFLGILSGILGAIIATKLFTLIDRNGNISRLLGLNINTPQSSSVEGVQSQASGESSPGNNKRGSSKSKGASEYLLTFISMTIGSMIIFVFVLYTWSFFIHGNLGPNKALGAKDSSDLTPFLNRIFGKKDNNFVVINNKRLKIDCIYNYLDKEDSLNILSPYGNIYISYDKKDWADKYKITEKVGKSGYIRVYMDVNADNYIQYVQPIKFVHYDNIPKDKMPKDDYITDEYYKNLGLTKVEFDSIIYKQRTNDKRKYFIGTKEKRNSKSGMIEFESELKQDYESQEYYDEIYNGLMTDENGNIIIKKGE